MVAVPAFHETPAGSVEKWRAALPNVSARGLVVWAIIALVLVLGNVVLGVRNAMQQRADTQQVLHTQVVLGALQSVFTGTIEAESAVRGYLLSGRDAYVADYDAMHRDTDRQLARLDSLVADNDAQRAHLPPLHAAVQRRLEILDRRLAAYRSGGLDSAIATATTESGRVQMDSIRSYVEAMSQHERELLALRTGVSQRSFRTSIVTGIGAGIAAIAGLLAFLYILRRQLELRTATTARLAAQREQLRVTLASIGDGVITTDVAATVASMNPIAEALTGWRESDAIGLPMEAVFRIVNEDSRQTVENPAARALRDGVVVGLANHTILIGKDGTERPIDDSAAPIRAPSGVVHGCVLVFRDVSDRRRADNQLRRSERQLQFALAGADMIAFELDPDTAALSTTDNATTVLGLADAQSLSRLESAFAILHPADRPRVQQAVADAMEKREQLQLLFRIVRPVDGEVRWLEVLGQPARDELDDRVRIGGVAMDVTERQQANDALRESERRFRSMADNAPEIIWITDERGRCTYLNRPWQQATGASATDDLGTRWLERIHPDDRPALVAALASPPQGAPADDRPPIRLELRLRHADGTWRHMLHSATPRLNADGHMLGWIGSAIDLEDRKRMEDELRKLASDLSLAHRQKDEFLATLAHELRNPLAPMRASVELIRRLQPDASETVVKAREVVERQLAQLVRLVDDLLDVSRITGGKLELRRERTTIDDIMQRALETSRPYIESGGHDVQVELPEPPVVLHGDVTRLCQVFGNLLNNAAKYSERAHTIRVTVAREDSMVVVRVRDEGIGLSTETLGNVFDLFMQVDHSLERSQGGLGVGLTLVKRLVELHGGTVEAQSAGLGRGSEFTVRLPADDVAEPAPASTNDAAPPAPVVAKRILLADDNVDAALSMAILMRLDGHTVEVANDGAQAVALAESMRPDIVFLDIGMPQLNGYEACARIRAMPWSQHTRIIALTGWGQPEDRRLSEAAGFDRHLVKPVDPLVMAAIIRS